MNIGQKIGNWREFNRRVAEMQSMSNRELSDLGINRGDIRTIAKQGLN